MLLFDENHQPLNSEALKAELANLDDVATPSTEEVESLLKDYYHQALQLEGAHFGFKASLAAPAEIAAFPGLGEILNKIRSFVCGVVNEGSTTQEIIDAILEAISTIIPGGIIIRLFIKPAIKYILSKGIGAFCHV